MTTKRDLDAIAAAMRDVRPVLPENASPTEKAVYEACAQLWTTTLEAIAERLSAHHSWFDKTIFYRNCGGIL